jgi:hypothetical protein
LTIPIVSCSFGDYGGGSELPYPERIQGGEAKRQHRHEVVAVLVADQRRPGEDRRHGDKGRSPERRHIVGNKQVRDPRHAIASVGHYPRDDAAITDAGDHGYLRVGEEVWTKHPLLRRLRLAAPGSLPRREQRGVAYREPVNLKSDGRRKPMRSSMIFPRIP